jgi:hypothetical protein
MKTKHSHSLDMLDRLVGYLTNHPSTETEPIPPHAITLIAEAAAVATSLRLAFDRQVSGNSTERGGTARRNQLKDALLEMMRIINRIARTLDPVLYPMAREHFRMPDSRSFTNLIATAHAFATHAQNLAQDFIDRGRPASFIADLRALASQVEASAHIKHVGRQTQVGGTAGIEANARRGIAIMRELDAILSPLWAGDPAKLATWKSAAHVPRRNSATATMIKTPTASIDDADTPTQATATDRVDSAPPPPFAPESAALPSQIRCDAPRKGTGHNSLVPAAVRDSVASGTAMARDMIDDVWQSAATLSRAPKCR